MPVGAVVVGPARLPLILQRANTVSQFANRRGRLRRPYGIRQQARDAAAYDQADVVLDQLAERRHQVSAQGANTRQLGLNRR